MPVTSPHRAAGARPWLAFAFCCLAWGSTFLFIAIGNDTLAPVWAGALRLGVSAVVLALIAVVLRRPWPRGPELSAALWFGFVDFGLSLPLLYWGQRKVSSSAAGVVFATIPLATLVFARMFGLERLSRVKIAAAIAGLAGVALLSIGPRVGGSEAVALAAVALSAVGAALSGVILKRAPYSDPVAMNAIAHAIGAAVCFPLSLAMGERWTLPAGSGLVSFLYLTLVGSIGVFIVFAWLVRHWSASRMSYITIVTPVVAMALGVGLRGERLAPNTLLGAAIVLGAVVVAMLAERRGEQARGDR